MDIVILKEQLKVELERLKAAKDTFGEYSESFISTAADSLEDMNSDFTNEAKKSLGSMADTKAPEVYKKIEEYCDKVQTVIDSFEQVDEDIANKIQN